jgi:hypothetical protein
MALDLKELERKLDECLQKETPESLREWLNKKRAEEKEADGGQIDCKVSLRPELQKFAEAMEKILEYQDRYKSGWENCTLQYLSMRLTQERKELAEAFQKKDKEAIKHECCDIANFCMMIYDNIDKAN